MKGEILCLNLQIYGIQSVGDAPTCYGKRRPKCTNNDDFTLHSAVGSSHTQHGRCRLRKKAKSKWGGRRSEAFHGLSLAHVAAVLMQLQMLLWSSQATVYSSSRC